MKDFQINHLHKELQEFSLKNKNKKRKEKKTNNMRYLKSQKFLLKLNDKQKVQLTYLGFSFLSMYLPTFSL